MFRRLVPKVLKQVFLLAIAWRLQYCTAQQPVELSEEKTFYKTFGITCLNSLYMRILELKLPNHYDDLICLPGHAFRLQFVNSVEDPLHAAPPFSARGDSALVRSRMPPRHVAVHAPHCPQGPHSQSIGRSSNLFHESIIAIDFVLQKNCIFRDSTLFQCLCLAFSISTLPGAHLGILYFPSRCQSYPLHSVGHSCNCIYTGRQVRSRGLSRQNRVYPRNCTWIGSFHNSPHLQKFRLSFPRRIFPRIHSKVQLL